jgi:DNA-binding NarL/FixJ family response regulator
MSNTNPEQRRILIVDDDQLIREGIQNYLLNFHDSDFKLDVDTAEYCEEAQRKISENHYDLVISDINLPDGDGFRVLEHVKAQDKDSRSALITAYKVEDYVKNAKMTGIYNIIAKTAPFDFDELSRVVNNLLDPHTAFGLQTYMAANSQVNHILISSSQDVDSSIETLQAFLKESGTSHENELLTALMEGVTNAVYHACRNSDGSFKYQKGQRIEQLEDNEQVSVYYGKDADSIGLAIVDQGGNFSASEILYWLERNMSGTGMMDTHGRGVFLMHRLVDRLLINISPGHKTEIIMLLYLDENRSAQYNKPIYINQF